MGWVAVYGAALVFASATSEARVLEPGTRLAFCGVYLDCHVGVEIAGVRQAKVLGEGAERVTPDAVLLIGSNGQVSRSRGPPCAFRRPHRNKPQPEAGPRHGGAIALSPPMAHVCRA